MQHMKHCLADGTVVGELEWRDSPGRTIEVHIDVHPDHQRKGIGRKLIDNLIQFITERDGDKPMCLYTFMAADNKQAVAFFTAVGFALQYVPNFYGTWRNAYFGCKTIGAPK